MLEELFISELKTGISLYKILQKNEPKDLKIFEETYLKILSELDKKYNQIDIRHIFDNVEIREIFFGLVLSGNNIDMSEIEKHIDTSTIPPLLINDIYKELVKSINKTTLVNYTHQIKQNKLLLNIQDELLKINNVLKRKINIEIFLSKYKNSVIKEYSRIQFFGIQLPQMSNVPKENKLEHIYVIPDFNINNEDVDLDDIYGMDNVVILGKPGAGKSTLTKYLVIQGLTHIIEEIPIRLELKEYDKYLRAHPRNNILDYISEDLASRFHTDLINRDNINDIFTHERFIIYFDGLDEIFNEARRAKIRSQIETFSENFSNNKIVVTSRIEGYYDTPFDHEEFDVVEIKDFDTFKINEYVDKWFNLDCPDPVINTEYREKFESERYSVDPKLLGNPLMLSIILILFTRGFSIPSSKLEIYKSCTETLVDRWENQKEFNLDIPKKNQALAYLAYWQFEKEIKHVDVLREMISFYSSFDDDYSYDDSKKHANALLDYLHNRSIYFDNNFVHKTFLEYYAAYFIFTKFEKKGKITERNKIIKEKINDSFWFVVLELLLSMIDQDQADNEVMEDLIDIHVDYNNYENLAFFMKNFRQLKNIGKKFRERFIENCFNICLDQVNKIYQIDVGLTSCPDDLAMLHNSFDTLSAESQIFVVSLVDEDLLEQKRFEVGAFFNELYMYDDLIDFNDILLPLSNSNRYAAITTFNHFDKSSYENFQINFPIALIDIPTDLVFVDFSYGSILGRVFSILTRFFIQKKHSDMNRILKIVEKSNVRFSTIPLPLSFGFIDEDIQQFIYHTTTSQELKSMLLALYYLKMQKTGVIYTNDFFEFTNKEQEVLISLYNENVQLLDSEKIYNLVYSQ